MSRDDGVPFSRKQMHRTISNICSDLIKHPGQVGLSDDDKFALSMMMLVRINAATILSYINDKEMVEEVMGLMADRTRRELRHGMKAIAAARAMGFGSTLSWDMLHQATKEDDDAE